MESPPLGGLSFGSVLEAAASRNRGLRAERAGDSRSPGAVPPLALEGPYGEVLRLDVDHSSDSLSIEIRRLGDLLSLLSLFRALFCPCTLRLLRLTGRGGFPSLSSLLRIGCLDDAPRKGTYLH